MSKTPETDGQVGGIKPWIIDDVKMVSWTDYECLSDLARSLESRLAEANERAERAERERDIARKGIAAVDRLICSSRGVVGLHLNGDEAPWEELLPPGHFCEWLEDFDAARGKK